MFRKVRYSKFLPNFRVFDPSPIWQLFIPLNLVKFLSDRLKKLIFDFICTFRFLIASGPRYWVRFLTLYLVMLWTNTSQKGHRLRFSRCDTATIFAWYRFWSKRVLNLVNNVQIASVRNSLSNVLVGISRKNLNPRPYIPPYNKNLDKNPKIYPLYKNIQIYKIPDRNKSTHLDIFCSGFFGIVRLPKSLYLWKRVILRSFRSYNKISYIIDIL